ncbi:MAG: hypothetical protein BGO55_20680 [Sphingobacteriales bacterium 50-39]|nr:DEAD/DEAH box helicase family protein [Sphingobacteriales bacterium]OJW59105.1 MAG: hypothetical protein BGO55_20680 [Sphingobacteriales bacterium 50-39]
MTVDSLPYSPKLKSNIQEIPNSILRNIAKDDILWPEQVIAIKALMTAFLRRKVHRLALIMPTGTGKMVMISRMIAALLKRKNHEQKFLRVLFVTDGIEGLLQAKDKMRRFAGIDLGLYYGDRKDVTYEVIATTYISWQNAYFPLHPETIDLLLLDEAHMGISVDRIATLDRHSNALCIALTASPDYSEERTLMRFFELGYKMDIKRAIDCGLISGFRNILLKSDINIDLKEICENDGSDFNQRKLAKAINIEARNRIGAEYLMFSHHPDSGVPVRHLQGIISCVDLSHAEAASEIINQEFEKYFPGQAPEHGFCRWISSKTPGREDILEWHKLGKIRYLAYADLLNQNYDDKRISVCLNLRLSYSKVLTTQRAGRTERIDESSPEKIALIVDIIDSYQGEVVRWPLLYSAAVGLTSHFTEDTARMAYVRYTENIGRGFYHHMGPISAELKEYVRKFEMRIVTEETDIISIINERRGQYRRKGPNDLCCREVSTMSGIPVSMIKEGFCRLEAEWTWYLQNPALAEKPKVQHERAVFKGKPLNVIFKPELNLFLKVYVTGSAFTERPCDMTVQKIHRSTHIPHSLIGECFDKLRTQWANFYQNPVINQRPKVHLYSVTLKTSPSETEDCINVNQLSLFWGIFFDTELVREMTKDDITVKEIAELAGRPYHSVRNVLHRIRRDWEGYRHKPDIASIPVIKVGVVKHDGRHIPVISKKDVNALIATYFSEDSGDLDISDYLTLDQIKEITGASHSALSKGYKIVQEEWDSFTKSNGSTAKPELNFVNIKQGAWTYRCIRKDQLPLLMQKMYGKKGFYQPSENDLTPADLAKISGLSKASFNLLFKNLRRQWDDYESGKPGIQKPDVYIKYGRGKKNSMTYVVDKSDAPKILEKFGANEIIPAKTSDELDTREISLVVGLRAELVRGGLKKLLKDWNGYNANDRKNRKPACRVIRVRKKGKIIYAIPTQDVKSFKDSYLKEYLTNNRIGEDWISYEELAGMVSVHKTTVKKYLTVLERDWHNHTEAPSLYPKPCAPLYKVKLNGQFTLFIEKRDAGTIVEHYFPFHRIPQKGDDDINVQEIANEAGLARNAISRGLKALESHWQRYRENSAGVNEPQMQYRISRRNGMVSFTINRKDLDHFISSYCGGWPVKPDDSQVTVKQLSEISGYSMHAITRKLKTLDNLWEKYNQKSTDAQKPPIQILKLNTRRSQFPSLAIPRSQIESFLTIYCNTKTSQRDIGTMRSETDMML